MLLPLYARHKTRHRQERNTESNTGKRQKATAASVRKTILGKKRRTATRGQLEERKKEKDNEIFDIGCFVEDVLLSFCVDQDGPGVGLACLDQCKTGGNNREDEVEKSKIKIKPSSQARKSGGDETSTRAGDAL